jgi:hypothetical protein
MAKITVEEQKDWSVLPSDSILHLKVDEVEIKEVQGQHGPWQKVEIKFKVLGIQAIGDGSPVEGYEDVIAGPIWGSVPFKLTDSAENKLRQWAEAILGMELGLGFELDTDYFLGRECRGITTQYDKRAKDPKTGMPFKGHQIDALLPKGTYGTVQTAPAPAQGQSFDQQWNQQPQQGYAQQAYQQQAAPAQQDPWATPGVPQQTQQQAPSQQQPAYQPPVQDPWATPGNDEPPF